jgi:hypothetical protein
MDTRCKFCGKKNFLTKGFALKWNELFVIETGKTEEMQVYHCQGGEYWHLRTKDKRNVCSKTKRARKRTQHKKIYQLLLLLLEKRLHGTGNDNNSLSTQPEEG